MKVDTYNEINPKLIRRRVSPYETWNQEGFAMDLQCPHCRSSDLKKVSLAYREGLYRVNTRTRLRGLLFSEGGPEVLAGRATTRGIQQTELSKGLSPPRKRSYGRLILWFTIITFVALGAYVFFVASSHPPVSTLPLRIYVFLAPVIFLILVISFWQHNRTAFPIKYAQWNRSFICQRCGAVTLHDVPSNSSPQT